MPAHAFTIVALGDSTTAGTPGFRSPLEAPPVGVGDERSQYAYWLSRWHADWKLRNRGVDGQRSDQIRARFDTDVLETRPDAVILIAGVNDIYQGRTVASLQQNLLWMYERARGAGIPLIAGTILPFNTATAEQNERMHAVNAWIREHARADANLHFCDTRGAVADPRDADRLRTSPDDLHPDPDGYRRMAEALDPVLSALLRRMA